MWLDVILRDSTLGLDFSLPFIVDTGSDFVVASANLLRLSEDVGARIRRTCRVHTFRGVDSQPVQFYACRVAAFGVGKLVFKDFPVHISFDPNVRKMLLGMTFLKMFYIMVNPVSRMIRFEAPRVTKFLITEGRRVPGLDSWVMPSSGTCDLNYLGQLSTVQESPESVPKGGGVTKLKPF